MSWIEMRGCLDTGTRTQASPHAFSRHCHNTDTCMAACVRGLVGARFQKGKDTDPLAQGFLLFCRVGASGNAHDWPETAATPPGTKTLPSTSSKRAGCKR